MSNQETRYKAQGTSKSDRMAAIGGLTVFRYLHLVPCVVCLILSSCENSQKEIDALTSSKPMIEEARVVESYLSQNGKIKAKLTAPLMLRLTGRSDSSYIECPRTLHSDFYDDSSKVETWVDSKYGKYLETQNKVYLRDSVVVITVKGDTLKTQELWWDQNTQMFYTTKVAYYTGINKNITGGEGMTATQDLASVIFHKPFGTVKRSNDGGF
jgi:LPS export ABC transporter protein LptC